MQYFDKPVGRVKIQTSKNIQLYCTPNRLIGHLLSNDFFSQNSDLPRFLNREEWVFEPGGMRRVQISDICIRFARYLYSRKQSWIISCHSKLQKSFGP